MEPDNHKSLTLRLANGKEEKFHSGSQMFDWFIQQQPNAVFESRQEKKQMRKQAKAVSVQEKAENAKK